MSSSGRYAIIIAVVFYPCDGKSEVITVKEGIHPKVYKTTITCACGNVIETLSTKQDIRVEICSACHPFYTGQKVRVVERGGRVERFKQKYGV